MESDEFINEIKKLAGVVKSIEHFKNLLHTFLKTCIKNADIIDYMFDVNPPNTHLPCELNIKVKPFRMVKSLKLRGERGNPDWVVVEEALLGNKNRRYYGPDEILYIKVRLE